MESKAHAAGVLVFGILLLLVLSALPTAMAGGLGPPPKPSSRAIPAAANSAAGSPAGGIALGNVQHTSGSVSSSPYQVTISGFDAGTQSLLVVGISSNN